MINNIYHFATPIASLIIILIITPIIRALALKYNFTDKPNTRKVHTNPVPPIGGVSVFLAAALSFSLFEGLKQNSLEFMVLVAGATILLVMGMLDDKLDLKAKYKFGIQIAIACGVYFSGIKIESLYGIFGVDTLPDYASFFLTVVVITGAVNAFNLTDGIDGLAASLALIGLGAFSIIAFITGNNALSMLFLAIIGALFGFLRFNLSKKRKIFMGDAGSLFLGYILVVSGILLIQNTSGTMYETQTLALVIGVLMLTILDSLRVYRGRIKKGYSPFRADKTHLHHLMLTFNIKHFTASVIIVIFSLVFIAFMIITTSFLSLTLVILYLFILFATISNLLSLNGEVSNWREKIRGLENTQNNRLAS